MQNRSGRPATQLTCDTCPRSCLTGPARLVGLGFRCWLSGFQTGDIACWEQGWDIYAGELGAARAKRAVTELACWVRTVSRSTQRSIEVFPPPCAVFCRDECLAVSLIAASQHGSASMMRSCAFVLLNSSAVDTVVDGAQVFGETLRDLDILLPATAMLSAAIDGHEQRGLQN